MVGLQRLPFKRTHTDDVLRQSSRSSSDDPKSADDEEKVTVPTVSKHGAVNNEGKDDGDRSLLEQDEGVTQIEALCTYLLDTSEKIVDLIVYPQTSSSAKDGLCGGFGCTSCRACSFPLC